MFRHLILLVLFGLMLPSLVAAASVYRWTDENGVVHYGDREPSGRSAEKVSVKSGTSRSSEERASPQAQVEAMEKNEAERTRRENESAVEEARRKQREANCQAAEANLQIIRSNARIRVEENGEQRYLTPEEIEEQKEKYKQVAEENCGPAASED
ncbi:protein of unknown function [Marinobacter daqiaonensis]|uniref:DUF4124 domain-containing protein n=1 Tax=Marinobacter daqiaonensis TaxID=650891 RepID=A0A1I6K635_9GAMM|nr:DUF4124 domain-containing protein [Marinobacter daqiaonensis]SFR86657.1 protein of unknown function [Marinobacter daqiaonensis]